jgi:hypothetical protein
MVRQGFFVFLGALLLTALSTQAPSQSIISGVVVGSVTDSSGGALPNASITLINANTNTVQATTTNAEGSYRFAFVPPGTYRLNVSATGFQQGTRAGLVVSAGTPITADVQLQVAGSAQSVEVSENATLLQTEDADVATTFNSATVTNMPNPGGDLTYVAQTAPGVVMNTQAGYGNFVADGMPGTSNLFAEDGTNFNDPFFSINNSGASNLLLGANDIAEVNVVNNGYSGQYGEYAGSQITYTTKSGTNSFHGDAVYNWNGRAMNANQFFNSGNPTPFNNFNQWATGVQGPIWKNRTFFDVDYEGLHTVLPSNATLTLVPSPQFQAATLANLPVQGHADEVQFYQQAFAIYNNAPGVSAATPVAGGGCGGFTAPGGIGTTVPCALQFRSTAPNANREFQWSGRVDHNFSDKDRTWVRVWRDNGFQPTYTSPFGKVFNDESNQPQMAAQVAETHVFGPSTVNEFRASSLFYSATFAQSDETGALAALPTFLTFAGNPFTSIGVGQPPYPPGFFYPQGRRVFQYQIQDDLSRVIGRHTFRIGFSGLHDDITALDFTAVAGPIHGVLVTDLADFFNGGGASTSLSQAFPTSPEEGLRFNTLGGYVADDWKVNERLTVSLNLRMENYANPTCQANCFARLATTFTGAPQPDAASTPYNQMILSGQHDAYPNTQALVWEPRVGIAWKPFAGDKTVIRTGAGIFADEIPGALAETAAFNSPNLNAFTIPNGALAPGAAGSLFTTAVAANQALLAQFGSGGSFNSISQAVPGFSAPNFASFPRTFLQPTYYKWNFEIEQALGWKTLLTLNYSGMHGVHLPVSDQGLNAYCPASVCTDGFAGLPTVPANSALGTVVQYLTGGVASYNGLTISLQRQVSAGLMFGLNYTWSHALDDVSNGGVANITFAAVATDGDITAPQNPRNFDANYGSSDYDVRHYVSANFVLSDMFRHARMRWGPNRAFGGWTLSGNWFFRTGLPFTIVDNAEAGALGGYNYGLFGTVWATPLAAVPHACTNAVNTPCLSTSQFVPDGVPSGFGTFGRNSIYGPHFFDVDLALMKDIAIGEHMTFSFGAQAYNAFNHPNFDQPVNDISNPNFGLSVNAVGPPTSLLGAFVGAGSSPRFVELKALLRF